jgi:hypothetical protein
MIERYRWLTLENGELKKQRIETFLVKNKRKVAQWEVAKRFLN